MNSAIELDRTQAQASLQLTGAEMVVRVLERYGARVVAGIPGGAVLPLYEAFARCSRIRHILARHEQAAGRDARVEDAHRVPGGDQSAISSDTF